MTQAATMPAPLEGVLVVALEQAVAAPLATSRLAAAGARVIKIERPEGDFARGYDRAGGDVSSYFAWLNRGKESIALNLREPEDRALLDRVISRADVFVQNLAVGAADRLGLGARRLRCEHPALVVCEISGYGEVGPFAQSKAYDLLLQAESGLLSISGAPGELGRVGVSVVDIATGLNAASSVFAALVRRFRSGEGAHIQVSLFDSIAEWMTVPLLHLEQLGAAPERVGLAHPSIAPYGGFATSDGVLLVISIQSDREWADLCTKVIDRPELVDDPRFATNVARVDHRSETDAAVAAAIGVLDEAEARRLLSAARIAHAAVNDVSGLSTHPHLRRIDVDVPDGVISMPASPNRADWEVVGAVPSIDEHGDKIRQEFELRPVSPQRRPVARVPPGT